PFRPRLDIKQPKDLLLRQPQARWWAILLQQLVEKLPLPVQHFGDAALNRFLGDEARHENRLALADTVDPVDRLVLDGRVPPAVEKEDIVRELEIESDTAGAIAHQDHVLGGIAAEALQHHLPFARGDAAVEA